MSKKMTGAQSKMTGAQSKYSVIYRLGLLEEPKTQHTIVQAEWLVVYRALCSQLKSGLHSHNTFAATNGARTWTGIIGAPMRISQLCTLAECSGSGGREAGRHPTKLMIRCSLACGYRG